MEGGEIVVGNFTDLNKEVVVKVLVLPLLVFAVVNEIVFNLEVGNES